MIYYAMIATAALLFASQFIFNQKYQREYGDNWSAALHFSILSAGAVLLISLVICGFRPSFSWFSLAVASAAAGVNIACIYVGILAFRSAGLSLYAVFTMLGGMILPTLYSIAFYDEPLTGAKVISCVLIALALLMTSRAERITPRALALYVGIFTLNGTFSILSKVQQSSPAAVDSVSYTALVQVCMLVLGGLLLLLPVSRRQPWPSWRGVGYAGAYAVLNGAGNLLTLTALLHLPASVQYPLITGGSIVFSTVIGMLRRERTGPRTVIAVVLALVAAVTIVL